MVRRARAAGVEVIMAAAETSSMSQLPDSINRTRSQ
jgi:hypothetical protein